MVAVWKTHLPYVAMDIVGKMKKLTAMVSIEVNSSSVQNPHQRAELPIGCCHGACRLKLQSLCEARTSIEAVQSHVERAKACAKHKNRRRPKNAPNVASDREW
ncbi:MAG: uncharacterized protein KVP18_000077 [Porospora cf. gigantea A]|uniref:uncharacterized protein n=1 Tax=Porospora cf. gigantea A TaxID=2853593 RepID=UPI00355A4EBE|nr:MAG: hypothetical protein KVP18_000077 [Porospora cf. gigantea A]